MREKFWLESLNRSDHSEEIGVDGRIILKWLLYKWGWRVWIGLIWLRIGAFGGL
jgi:hypothetical protein